MWYNSRKTAIIPHLWPDDSSQWPIISFRCAPRYNPSRKTAIIPLLWLDDYTICRIKQWNSLTAADCFCSSKGDAPAFPEPLDQTAGCGLGKGAFYLSRPGERAWGELNPAGQPLSGPGWIRELFSPASGSFLERINQRNG